MIFQGILILATLLGIPAWAVFKHKRIISTERALSKREENLSFFFLVVVTLGIWTPALIFLGSALGAHRSFSELFDLLLSERVSMITVCGNGLAYGLLVLLMRPKYIAVPLGDRNRAAVRVGLTAGAAVMISFTLLVDVGVSVFPGSSTDSIALLFVPFWLLILGPFAFGLGWLIERLRPK